MNVLLQRPVEKAKTLVENRTDYLSDTAMLSIYDTYEKAQKVSLRSRDLLYCGMLSGKKVMHVSGEAPVDFFPSESFVLPADQEVFIDFPWADWRSPTTCLAIDIDKREVDRVLSKKGEESKIYAKGEASLASKKYFHTYHDSFTQSVLKRTVDAFLGSEDRNYRQHIIDLTVNYLISNVANKESFCYFLKDEKKPGCNLFIEEALFYLKSNLSSPFDIDKFCKYLHVGKSKLYYVFKRELGITPERALINMRCEVAKSLLLQGRLAKEACFLVGFKSQSHFSRAFSSYFGRNPKDFLIT